MASFQIHPRIDEELWASLRQPGEKDTALLQRLVAEHLAHQARDERLKTIDPNPDIALGMLEHSYLMLKQLVSKASLSIPQVASVSQVEAPPQPVKKTKKSKFDVSQY